MKCPIDQTDLVMSERQGVEIDYCPTCRGVWLDRGELDKIIDRAAESQPPGSTTQGYTGKEWDSPSVGGMSGKVRPLNDRDTYEEHRDRERYDDDDYRSNGKRKKKRGSFLEDLFDFG